MVFLLGAFAGEEAAVGEAKLSTSERRPAASWRAAADREVSSVTSMAVACNPVRGDVCRWSGGRWVVRATAAAMSAAMSTCWLVGVA